MSKDKTDVIMNTVDDLVSELLHYGRKEDEDLPRGEIEALIASGALTVDQIVERFRDALESALPEVES